MDPGRLRCPLPPSLSGHCGGEASHLGTIPRGWKLVQEGDARDHLLQHPHRIPGLGPRECHGRGTPEEIREDREGDGLPPAHQHSVQPGATWATLVHR